MKAVDVRKQVKSQLKLFSKERDLIIKRDSLLIRKTPVGISQVIGISISSYGEIHRIGSPSASVRIEDIETILSPFNEELFFGRATNPNTPSILLISNFSNVPKIIFDGKEGSMVRVKDEKELNIALELSIQVIKEVIIPFLDEVMTLSGFNSYLEHQNLLDKIGLKETDPFTMIRWLLVKKIIKDTDFDILKENRLVWLEKILEEDKVGNLPYYNAYLKYFDFLENL